MMGGFLSFRRRPLDLTDFADKLLWQAGLRQEDTAASRSRAALVRFEGASGQHDDGRLPCLISVPQPTHELNAIKRTVHANLGHDDVGIAGEHQSLVRGAGGL